MLLYVHVRSPRTDRIVQRFGNDSHYQQGVFTKVTLYAHFCKYRSANRERLRDSPTELPKDRHAHLNLLRTENLRTRNLGKPTSTSLPNSNFLSFTGLLGYYLLSIIFLPFPPTFLLPNLTFSLRSPIFCQLHHLSTPSLRLGNCSRCSPIAFECFGYVWPRSPRIGLGDFGCSLLGPFYVS